MSKVRQMLEELEQELRANKQYSAADKLLPIIEEAKKDGLIPCSEKLPEEDGIYLLQTESGMMFSGEFCSDMGEFGCWGESYDSCTYALLDRHWVGYGDVVAWMERPEPYKGE